ncbi:MAG: hypothetical protein STSR0004_18050 [Peptococcaceae bacterium]
MASLGEVLGALISQVGKGRGQADLAVLEVAEVYRNHPLLAEFPVPRMTLDEVVVELKMSIAATPVSGRFLAPKARSEVLAQLGKRAEDLINTEPFLKDLGRECPELKVVWKDVQKEVLQRLTEIIPAEIEIEPKAIACSVASLIRGQLVEAMLAQEARVPAEKALSILKKEVSRLETKLVPQIQENISKVLQAQPPLTDRLEVLIAASELENIPPEKITVMKLTLREADRAWTQIDTEADKVKEKLVPG